MSFITKAWNWVKKLFSSGIKDADKIAIVVTEEIKTGLQSGVIGWIANVAAGLLHSQIPTEIVTLLNNNINKVLAVELALQGIPDNPTADDILSFEQSVLKAFNVTDNKSKLYTTLAAQIYGIILAQVNSGTKLTFAELVADVEAAYQDYLNDQASDDAAA